MTRALILALVLVAAPAWAQIRFRVGPPTTETLRFSATPGPHDTRVMICAGSDVGTAARECFQVFNDGVVDISYADGREARYKSLGAVPKADRDYFGRIYRIYRLTRCYEVPGPLWWRIRPSMSTRACGAPT